MCCLHIWGKLGVSGSARQHVSLPSPFPWTRRTGQPVPLSWPCLSLRGRLLFPASPRIYSNKPITSCYRGRRESHLTPLLLQNQPPTASACSLCSQEQLLCAQHGRCPPSPGLRACATNTVDVICSVLCVMRLAPCITLGWKFPPYQGGRGWRLKHHP